jgi:hypothetical protein
MSLLGWRQWAVDRDGMLRPAWTPWSPFPPELLLWRPDGVTRAHCLRGGEHPPAAARVLTSGEAAGEREDPSSVPYAGCVCGLYGYRTPESLHAAPAPRWTRLPIVVGVARLGGRVVIGERGYRAALGYPAAVLDPAGVVSPEYRVARYRSWPALVTEWRDENPPAAA